MDKDSRTLWCGNLSTKVTEDLLYELFLQAGPLEEVKIPKDRDSRPRKFGFVTFKHDESVDYAIELFKGTSLFNRELCMDRKVRSVPDQPFQVQQPMPLPLINPLLSGMIPNIPYGMPLGFSPPYASQDQTHYRGPMDNYSSRDSRNSSRRHPYRRR